MFLSGLSLHCLHIELAIVYNKNIYKATVTLLGDLFSTGLAIEFSKNFVMFSTGDQKERTFTLYDFFIV